jgi:hypothetical protein
MANSPLPPFESLVKVHRIILPDDYDCTISNSEGYCYCRLWSEGDHVDGVVEVFAPSNTKLSIEVRLEGKLFALLVETVTLIALQAFVGPG